MNIPVRRYLALLARYLKPQWQGPNKQRQHPTRCCR